MATSKSLSGAMNNSAMVNLYDPFKMFNNIWDYQYSTTATLGDTYPPYNIREIDENTRVWELALAGFSKEELSITVNNRVLTISGEKKEDKDVKYLHKGIATRKFTKSTTLWEFWEVDSADYNDGILYIVMSKHVPDEKKPRMIDIK